MKEITKKGNGSIMAILYKDADGNVSWLKVGIIAAAVAYTLVFNPFFLLALFEIAILLYFVIALWKICMGLLTDQDPLVAA